MYRLNCPLSSKKKCIRFDSYLFYTSDLATVIALTTATFTDNVDVLTSYGLMKYFRFDEPKSAYKKKSTFTIGKKIY